MPLAPDLPELTSARLRLRGWTEADITTLLALLNEPSVAQWWGGQYDAARLRRDLDDPEVYTYVIELGGEVAGMLMFSEEADPMYHSAGMDIAISAAHQGKGLGPEALSTLARHLFDVRGHHRLTIDPAADNDRAIGAYASIGFKPVGVMRRYEQGADGTFHDGLLMDMLREDFRPR